MAPTSTESVNRPQMTGEASFAEESLGEVPAVRLRDLSLLDCVTLALPRFLAGFTLPDWLRMLRRHEWQLDAIFLPRAATATLGTVVTTLLKPFDDACRMDPLDDATWRRPIFILGLPRSGTTHLFNLLARDDRFAWPTQMDVYHPHTFITLRRLGLHRILGALPHRRRAMDAVRVGWLSPAEDSIALTILAGVGGLLPGVFRRTAPREDMPAEQFRVALSAFTRKLVHIHRRPLLLKSPGHTLRIPDILAVFPEARFVTILRNPEAVLASAIGAVQTAAMVWMALQWPPARRIDEMVDSLGSSLDAYFEARHHVPPANLVEVRHEDLVADEAGTLHTIYAGLGMVPPAPPGGGDACSRPYARNVHPTLDDAVRNRLHSACRSLYEAGWYGTRLPAPPVC